MDRVEFRYEGKTIVCRLTGAEGEAAELGEWVIEVDGREEARIEAEPMETLPRVEVRALVAVMQIDARRRFRRRAV